jgi:hypothetical protein
MFHVKNICLFSNDRPSRLDKRDPWVSLAIQASPLPTTLSLFATALARWSCSGGGGSGDQQRSSKIRSATKEIEER